jgi:CO/xanthine dehydrogenase Mo-binding subunit
MAALEDQQDILLAEYPADPAGRFSRRSLLLRGGSLIVAFSFVGGLFETVAAQADTVPYPVVPFKMLDSWLQIGADGTVTATTSRVDLGQGNRTALSQIIAEELFVPFEKIDLLMGDTMTSADQGITAGSSTIRSAGPQLRQIAADARLALLNLAAQHFQVPVGLLSTTDGVIQAPTGTIRYADLVAGKGFGTALPTTGTGSSFVVTGPATPKSPLDYTIVGQEIPRSDIPGKVTGKWTFVHDVKLPGMMHARIVRPRTIGSTLVTVGDPIAGTQVIRIDNLLAVIADDEWDAIRGAQALKTTWTDWKGLPDTADIPRWIKATATTPNAKAFSQVGNADAAIARSATTLAAEYYTPIETHGSIGPSCAVADVSNGQATVHSGTQGPQNLQGALAQALQIPSTSVRVINYDASGCYGRNGADPASVEAALISQAIGKPVRVQWMRADEHGWDPKGPAVVSEMTAGLDASGNVLGYRHNAYIPPLFDVTMIPAVLAGRATRGVSSGSWAGPLLMNFPASILQPLPQHLIGADASNGVGLVTSWLRGPGQYQIGFAMESFTDELAAAANMDPIQFRLKYLVDPRAVQVLKAAAVRSNWQTRASTAGLRSGDILKGRGVGMSLRDGTYNATVAEVEVNRKTGKVSVKNIFAVQDNGLTINPRAVRRQMVTGSIQTTSRVLFEEVTLDGSSVTSIDWVTYPIMRFKDHPNVDALILNRPQYAATGSGEGACCPVPGAIGNAVFDATGVRIRSLPLRPARVKKALDAAASA